MRVVDLLTELSPGTATVSVVHAAILDLVTRGLIEGPTPTTLGYALTEGGRNVLRPRSGEPRSFVQPPDYLCKTDFLCKADAAS